MKMIVILVVMCSIYSVTYLAFTIYRIAGNYMVLDRKTQTMIELILILVYVVSSMLNHACIQRGLQEDSVLLFQEKSVVGI